MIVFSVLGAMNGLILSGPRVYYAMARDGIFFKELAGISGKYHVPVYAIVFQGALALLMTQIATFAQLVGYAISSAWIFYALTVAGIRIVRRRTPEPPPFRCPAYALLGSVFVAFAAFIVISQFVRQPAETAAGLAIIGLGLPAYWGWERRGRFSELGSSSARSRPKHEVTAAPQMRTRIRTPGGMDLAVNDGGRWPAVVFLHGLGGFRQLWDAIVEPLRAAGFRAIAYDQRGHGESADASPPWTIGDLAEDLVSVLDSLSISRACVVGHSMGGRAMFQFALAHPDRIWAVVPVAAHSEAPRSPYREELSAVRDATLRDGLPGFRTAFEAAGEIPLRVSRDAGFAAEFEHA